MSHKIEFLILAKNYPKYQADMFIFVRNYEIIQLILS